MKYYAVDHKEEVSCTLMEKDLQVVLFSEKI